MLTQNTSLLVAALLAGCSGDTSPPVDHGPCATTDGQCIFRHDTFGDEQLWTDTLRLHELVGTLPPTTALRRAICWAGSRPRRSSSRSKPWAIAWCTA